MSDPARSISLVDSLTAEEHSLLLFERAWHAHPAGKKLDEARRVFGLTETAYYRRLAEVARKPAALAAEPMLVKRLLRLMDGRAARRNHARTT